MNLKVSRTRIELAESRGPVNGHLQMATSQHLLNSKITKPLAFFRVKPIKIFVSSHLLSPPTLPQTQETYSERTRT